MTNNSDALYYLRIFLHAHETGNSVPPHIVGEAKEICGKGAPDDIRQVMGKTMTDKEYKWLHPLLPDVLQAVRKCNELGWPGLAGAPYQHAEVQHLLLAAEDWSDVNYPLLDDRARIVLEAADKYSEIEIFEKMKSIHGTEKEKP